MKKLRLVCVVVGCLIASACTAPDSAMEVLTAQGYTDIKFTGYDYFACSKDDTYHTGFIAKTPAGILVKGVVCKGIFFKGSTIRFD